MAEMSPAVERAAAKAHALVQTPDVTQSIDLKHWLLALTEEEEGRPALLLERLGYSIIDLRTAWQEADWPGYQAPNDAELYSLCRDQGLRLQGDATVTTELLLFTLLHHFQEELEENGQFLQAVPKLTEWLRTVERSPETASFDGEVFQVTDTREVLEAARILDVNANRAQESLRVLDDFARFILNDRVLTDQLKTLRHGFVQTMQLIPSSSLLAARDTRRDVGTDISTATEYERPTSLAVAQVNLHRLQEAFRSLEEFGKVLNTDFARKIEQLRYRVYTLEKALLRPFQRQAQLQTAQLYVLLTGSQCEAALDWTIEQAAEGGAEIFQLREKHLTDQELLERARNVRRWTQKAGVLFLMNDRVDIAKLADADGVHLGQDDLSVQDARQILGPEKIIGVSTHHVVQVEEAVLNGADYIGVGPTFPSITKEFDHFPGLDFAHKATEMTSLPAFAIGGITLANVDQLREIGVHRIAVSSTIAKADDPAAVAQSLKAKLGQLGM